MSKQNLAVVPAYQIFKTQNYDLFKIMSANRDLNQNHLRLLTESFEENPLVSPILVNEKYEVIDGQHRLSVQKELGLPVYFFMIPGYTIKEVAILNDNTSEWKWKDHLKTFCEAKNPNYLTFRNFMKRYPDLGFQTCVALLSGRMEGARVEKAGLKRDMWKSGEFQVQDEKKADKMAKMLLDIKQYYSGFNRRSFMRAMMDILQHRNYNHDEFLARLKRNPASMVHCNDTLSYKMLIEDIFNYRRKEKVSLRF